MTELEFHRDLAYGVIATGAIVFISLFFIVAPYGRHSRAGWGLMISNRLGWTIMESPSAVGFAAIYLAGRHALEPVPLVLASLWLCHYVHRAFIYPLRMTRKLKQMPASVSGMAITFNVINAYLNARWISELGTYDNTWLKDPRFVLGVALFALGMWLNIASDNVLFNLRKPGDEGYKIPFGGAYRWVTSPNYLGELIEWGGFALAAWSLGALAFFLFTFANLVPRAVSHHRWYKERFKDYPPHRKAVIPFLV
jgi:protein-S-isoprenylcysteine O-methyltransferase Ste14